MCDCEGPRCHVETTRKARVEHRCCECGNAIGRGDQYEYFSGVWDYGPNNFKTCLLCAAERKRFVSELTGWDCAPCFGELYEGYAPDELPPHHRRYERAAISNVLPAATI
jgi:hypothetical protein